MRCLILSTLLSALLLGPTIVLASEQAAGGADGQDVAGQGKTGAADGALVLIGQGKLDEAEALLLQAVKTTPAPERIYYELGCIHEQRGDSAKAIVSFKEGIRIHDQGRR